MKEHGIYGDANLTDLLMKEIIIGRAEDLSPEDEIRINKGKDAFNSYNGLARCNGAEISSFT